MSETDDGLDDLVPLIVDALPAILTEVRDILADQYPDYARFLTEEFDEVVVGAKAFATRLVSLARCGPATVPQFVSEVEEAVFEEIGRLHHRHDQDVTGLLAAYRTGASVTWRHVAAAALQRSIPAETFAALASAVFAAVEQLSSASLRGYVREQSNRAFVRDRQREELADLLLSNAPGGPDLSAVRATARKTDWAIPAEAAIVLVDPDNEVARSLLARLDDSCLLVRRPAQLLAIVPDASGPGRRAWLQTILSGAGAIVGMTVALRRLPASLQFAEISLRLRNAQLLHGDPVFVEDHLDAIIVHHDPDLLDALRRRYLAPLDALPEATGTRLAETLTSWLLHMGNRKAVANDLHVHPQTVRYRLSRLRELFGAGLDDPAVRAALLLALAWGPAATSAENRTDRADEPVSGPKPLLSRPFPFVGERESP
ncbi:PucR family transcriptional regulator [Pseudonocardia hispaniensis]|uniref:PucR family transcriptional regulator n=1 Tax=Pseudonocardia hispaniensis TaxID=904933 RepID=A0ABW1J352_9PSEU